MVVSYNRKKVMLSDWYPLISYRFVESRCKALLQDWLEVSFLLSVALSSVFKTKTLNFSTVALLQAKLSCSTCAQISINKAWFTYECLCHIVLGWVGLWATWEVCVVMLEEELEERGV